MESVRSDILDIDIEIDGIAELWWENAETMRTSIQSPEEKAMFADGALFIDKIKTYLIGEKIIIKN